MRSPLASVARAPSAALSDGAAWELENPSAPPVQRDLHLGAICGSARRVREAAAAGADLAWLDARGGSALHMAARGPWDRSAAVAELIALGAPIDLLSKSSLSPLMEACASKGPALPLLIQAGASLGLACDGGWTPAVHACQAGDARALGLLLEAGADPCLRAAGRPPIVWACVFRQSQCAMDLARAGGLACREGDPGAEAIAWLDGDLAKRQGYAVGALRGYDLDAMAGLRGWLRVEREAQLIGAEAPSDPRAPHGGAHRI